MKELVLKQAELNALLDLDRHDAQVVSETPEPVKDEKPASPVPAYIPVHHPEPAIPAAVMQSPAQRLADVVGEKPTTFMVSDIRHR